MELLQEFYKDEKRTHFATLTQVIGCMVGMKTDTYFIISTSAIIQVKFVGWDRSGVEMKPVFNVENYNYCIGNVSGLTYLFLKLHYLALRDMRVDNIEKLKRILVKGYKGNRPIID